MLAGDTKTFWVDSPNSYKKQLVTVVPNYLSRNTFKSSKSKKLKRFKTASFSGFSGCRLGALSVGCRSGCDGVPNIVFKFWIN